MPVPARAVPSVALPRFADTVVLGGGTAGAAVAGLLAAGSAESVLVLEAGPDYGPYDPAAWPADLLDARALGRSHDWGYGSGETSPGRTIPFERAMVIGGCSAHNGCAAIWGSRCDDDAWAALLGEPGWSADGLLPLFRAVNERLRVRVPEPAEITPFQAACLAAAHIDASCVHYYHSVGTCAMGPATDPLAVVDAGVASTASPTPTSPTARSCR